MSDETSRPPGPDPTVVDPESADEDDRSGAASIGGLSELVRRAVSAGMGAGRTAKDELTRAAAGEMRNWLDKLDLEKELAKALATLTVEIHAEIRFKPNAEGTIVPEVVSSESTVKPAKV